MAVEMGRIGQIQDTRTQMHLLAQLVRSNKQNLNIRREEEGGEALIVLGFMDKMY